MLAWAYHRLSWSAGATLLAMRTLTRYEPNHSKHLNHVSLCSTSLGVPCSGVLYAAKRSGRPVTCLGVGCACAGQDEGWAEWARRCAQCSNTYGSALWAAGGGLANVYWKCNTPNCSSRSYNIQARPRPSARFHSRVIAGCTSLFTGGCSSRGGRGGARAGFVVRWEECDEEVRQGAPL